MNQEQPYVYELNSKKLLHKYGKKTVAEWYGIKSAQELLSKNLNFLKNQVNN